MGDARRTVFGGEYWIHWGALKWLRENDTSSESGAPFVSADALRGRYVGQTAFVLCPGPSLGEYAPELFARRLTIGVNSAAFYVVPRYWCVVETRFARFAVQSWRGGNLADYMPLFERRDYVMTLRAAVSWAGQGGVARRIYYTRHEEDGSVPWGARGRESSTFNAIATARLMGCARCVVIGMDLSKPGGQAYVPGVPHTRRGAARNYVFQAATLRAMTFPGMEVLNASPYSGDVGLPQIAQATAEAALRDASEVEP